MRLSSIERCLRLIELLSENPQGLKLKEISQVLQANPSTVHHLLSTLVYNAYVIQDGDSKKYSLGTRILEISRRVLNSMDIRRTARPHLEALHRSCQESVHLAVLRSGKAVYIEVIKHHGGLSLATDIGFSADPHATSGGKVLLAGLCDREVAELYASRALEKFGPRTITRIKDLMAELGRIRRQGYAVDDEEYDEGGRCVAAPVWAGGQVVAAVSVTGNIFTITRDRIRTELEAAVRQTAADISNLLKW
jgi:DNA-binding IclR family transcriptional regulator